MKPLSTLFLFSLMLASCSRELPQPEYTYIRNVQTSLKDDMQSADYADLDFTRSVLTKVDSAGLYLLRVPYKGKTVGTDFVLVKTDKEGRVEMGKIIHLEGKTIEDGEGVVKRHQFDGSVAISTLDRKTTIHSPIRNGFIEAFHGNTRSQRTESLMPSGETLPEVVVVAYINNDSGLSYSEWCYLQSFFYDGDGSSSGDYYGSLDGGGGGGSYGSSGYSGGSGSDGGYYYSEGGVVLDPPILIDFETDINKSAIDLERYLRCFDLIPDAGAICSIEIFADIPVDSDPNKLFNWDTESPGHSFLQIKKSNGSQSAVQNIGFYPNKTWKTLLTTAPIEGKFVDNSGHEFNASFKMNVSAEHLKSILTEIQSLARFIQYDIDEYNCTDFALDVFNKIRTNKITIPMYDIPGGTAAGGPRTPQGLYNQLKSWKESGHPEAQNINITGYKGWVAQSIGPCN
jgi:hypothetical protein